MEKKLRSALHRAGYRFRKNVRGLVGRPDIVFAQARVVIFVDGDFWHARILKEGGLEALQKSLKTENRAFWVNKLRGNYERDLAVTEKLEQLGWLVVRVWENDLKRKMDAYLQNVIAALESRIGSGSTRPTAK